MPKRIARGPGRPETPRTRRGFSQLAYAKMRELGLTYDDLTERTALSKGIIHLALNGSGARPPKLRTMLELTSVLGLDENEALKAAGMGFMTIDRAPTEKELSLLYA